MATTIDDPPAGALAAAKAYLRIDQPHEDATIAALIASACALCERFTGLVLIAGDRSELLPAAAGIRQRLKASPIAAITGVAAIGAAGGATALPAAGYAIDIDAAGDGWVLVSDAAGATRVRVDYRVGLSPDWARLPAPPRQGVVRLAAHLHAHRDEADDAGPPAAVAALWRPYRRVRLR